MTSLARGLSVYWRLPDPAPALVGGIEIPMDARFWSTLILLAAFGAAGLAFWLQFDPCVPFAVVATLGVGTLCAIVLSGARRELARNRARLMRDAQMCPACGYTIRVDTDRCPECGTPTDHVGG